MVQIKYGRLEGLPLGGVDAIAEASALSQPSAYMLTAHADALRVRVGQMVWRRRGLCCTQGGGTGFTRFLSVCHGAERVEERKYFGFVAATAGLKRSSVWSAYDAGLFARAAVRGHALR